MISEFLAELGERVDNELTTPVEIEDCDVFPKVSDLYLEKRAWKRMNDVVVVAADLKGSTKLNFDKYARTSASLYEALTGNMVRIVDAFNPEFVAIQGDGLFAIYHGNTRYQRALSAGVTLKTFSEQILVPSIEKNLHERFPSTGLKIGMAAGILVAKRVGVRGVNEPIWAGKPVNWAVKCAETAQVHEMVVTHAVFNRISDNDYIRYSCGCGGSISDLWSNITVTTLPEEAGAACMKLRSAWCVNCGDDFCEAILDGQTQRENMPRRAA